MCFVQAWILNIKTLPKWPSRLLSAPYSALLGLTKLVAEQEACKRVENTGDSPQISLPVIFWPFIRLLFHC
jgi:hypothetical protein